LAALSETNLKASSSLSPPYLSLRGLDVQAPREFVGVGVVGDGVADLVHEDGPAGDRVLDLDLVRPPIREAAGPARVVADVIGDLVPLEDVLERADLEVEVRATCVSIRISSWR
jgi:hypothetical protein